MTLHGTLARQIDEVMTIEIRLLAARAEHDTDPAQWHAERREKGWKSILVRILERLK